MDFITFRTLSAKQSISNPIHGGNQQTETTRLPNVNSTQAKKKKPRKNDIISISDENAHRAEKLPGSSAPEELQEDGHSRTALLSSAVTSMQEQHTAYRRY